MEKIIGCDLCGKSIRDKLSHNAMPIIEGRCCKDCNENKVLPARGIDIIHAKKMRDMVFIDKRHGGTRRDYWVNPKTNEWMEVKDDEV